MQNLRQIQLGSWDTAFGVTCSTLPSWAGNFFWPGAVTRVVLSTWHLPYLEKLIWVGSWISREEDSIIQYTKISTDQAACHARLISYSKRKGGKQVRDLQSICNLSFLIVISDSVMSLSSVISDSVIRNSTLTSMIFHVSSYINFHFLVISSSVISDSVISISR